MRITICLISKGRKGYLERALRSYEAALEFPDTDVLILDNGSAPEEQSLMIEWVKNHSEKSVYVRNNKNDIHPAHLFSTLREHQLSWVILPGDDDIFEPNILEKVRKKFEEIPHLIAVGTSAKIIDEFDKEKNEIITPYAMNFRSHASSIASFFHEPAFTWPALFFDIRALPESLPNSRYVFDWWVGTQLILSGKFTCMNEIGVYYRIHSSQESNLTGTRRKFLEANVMLHELVESDKFISSINSLSSSEVLLFWDEIMSRRPVYGNSEVFHGLMAHLLFVIRVKTIHKNLGLQLSGMYASQAGIFLASKDADNFFAPIGSGLKDLRPNISLKISPKSCSYIEDLLTEFRSFDTDPSYNVSCSHSPEKRVDLRLDCDVLKRLSNDEAVDRVLKSLTDSLEQSGILSFSISSGEKWIINQIRFFRKFLPSRLKSAAKSLKK